MDMELAVQSKPRSFLCLPREIRDLIYGLIIPTDKIFIFLLADDDKHWSHRTDFLTFDRGYAFPTFGTSVFRLCHQAYAEAMEMWLKKGHFRLEMGEDLGPRKSLWRVACSFMSHMSHCDLSITISSAPGVQRIRDKLEFERSMVHPMIKRIVDAFVHGQKIRQMEIKFRNVERRVCLTAQADDVLPYFVRTNINNIETGMGLLRKAVSFTGVADERIHREIFEQLLCEVEKLSRPHMRGIAT
jgi:hypothetical protein